MAGLVRSRPNEYQRIPGPGGMTGEQASTVYSSELPGGYGTKYGEMPMPSTMFVTSATALKSVDVVPDVISDGENSTIVKRGNRMNGYIPTEGVNDNYQTPIPPMNNPVYSSKFQPWLIGPIVNFVQNACLYRAGAPAGIGLPGRWAPYLSFRVDQLVTRSSGGPGPAQMTTSQRRFARVQTIPRYSTMPQSYKTESAQS